MVYGCGNKCIKYLLFTFNFLVFIVGAAVLSVSLALALNSNAQAYFTDVINEASSGSSKDVNLSGLQALFYVTAGIGGFICVTGFLGCCGAACENVCLLGLFFVVMLLLFLGELAVGITAFVIPSQFECTFKNFYKSTVVESYITSCGKGQQAWNSTQQSLQCCGCYGLSDYAASSSTASPDGCTPEPSTATWAGSCPGSGSPCPGATAQTVGCCDKLWDDMTTYIYIVGGVSIGFLVIELFAMIFSCCMCRAIKHRGKFS